MWEYETEEGAHDLYMDTGEEIRFRVVDESFVDTSPRGPVQQMPPLPVRNCQRRRLHTRLWDPSVSQAWAFSPGGPATSPGAGQWTLPACRKVLRQSVKTRAAKADANSS